MGGGFVVRVVTVAEPNGPGRLARHRRSDDAARSDEKSLAGVVVQVLAYFFGVFLAWFGFFFGLLFRPVLKHGEMQSEPALTVGAVKEARVCFLSKPALAVGELAQARGGSRTLQVTFIGSALGGERGGRCGVTVVTVTGGSFRADHRVRVADE